MNLTKEDKHTIEQYIRQAHGGYTGPRLVELHMNMSRLVVATALMKARYESKGKA